MSAPLGATAFGQPLRAHLDKKPIRSANKRWDWLRRGAPILLDGDTWAGPEPGDDGTTPSAAAGAAGGQDDAQAGEAAPPMPGGVVPLSELEKIMILRSLESTSGNRTQAAELLGISVRTLRNKLNEYRLQGMTIS